MSDADASDGDGTPEKVQINLRLTRSFLEDIDATWKDRGSIPGASSSATRPATR